MAIKGTIDFAFITTPFTMNDKLEVHHVYELNSILVAPSSYKDEIKDKVSIKELTKYPFILLSKEMQYREHINSFLNNNGVKINPEYEVDSSSTLMPLVDNGCGLTFIPSVMAEKSINEGKCFKIDLIETIPQHYISFVIKKDTNHSSIIYDIKKTLLEHVKKDS